MRMIDDTKYQWEVYYDGVLLGVANINNDDRHNLIKDFRETLTEPFDNLFLAFKIVKKQSGVEE
jgi:hypothetical protein